jgi:cytochrome c1
MIRPRLSLSAALFALSLFAADALAAPKTYQVTGPVLEVNDTSVTVEKGKEKWQLQRDKDTKLKGDLKVGQKVTIEYTMKATSIEAKETKAEAAKAEAKDKPGPGKKEK